MTLDLEQQLVHPIDELARLEEKHALERGAFFPQEKPHVERLSGGCCD